MQSISPNLQKGRFQTTLTSKYDKNVAVFVTANLPTATQTARRTQVIGFNINIIVTLIIMLKNGIKGTNGTYNET